MTQEKSTNLISKALLALGLIALALALPAQAVAQADDPRTDPTAAQYESPIGGGGDDQDEEPTFTATGGGPDGGGGTSEPLAASTESASTSTLPFTGFDAGVMALVALLLGATGFALRRMSAVR